MSEAYKKSLFEGCFCHVPIVATLAARIDAPLFSHALAPPLPAAQIFDAVA
jgi:hypothetical protein